MLFQDIVICCCKNRLFSQENEKTGPKNTLIYLKYVILPSKRIDKMSIATLNGLLEYLYATLSPSNQKWLGEHLIEHAEIVEDPTRPYTKEELLQMAETGRKQIAEGYYYTTEEVISACAEEFHYN